jgi:ADP-ribose pyrophosphatase
MNNFKYLELKKSGTYEYVSRKIGKCGAVVIIPLYVDPETRDVKFQLILSQRPTFEKTILEFPAGLLDKEGESKIEAAARELKEETGWNAIFDKDIITNFPSPSSAGLSDELLYFVPAILTTQDEPDHQEGESITVLPLMTLQEMGEYFVANQDSIIISSRVLAFYAGLLYGSMFSKYMGFSDEFKAGLGIRV